MEDQNQSRPAICLCLIVKMVSGDGDAPSTYRLGGGCSSNMNYPEIVL